MGWAIAAIVLLAFAVAVVEVAAYRKNNHL